MVHDEVRDTGPMLTVARMQRAVAPVTLWVCVLSRDSSMGAGAIADSGSSTADYRFRCQEFSATTGVAASLLHCVQPVSIAIAISAVPVEP